MKLLLSIGLCLFLSIQGLAQTQNPIQLEEKSSSPCVTRLEQAEDLYTSGLLNHIPDLEDCIKREFGSEERVRALRLMAWVYLYKDEYQKAEETMERLLRTKPDFQPNRLLDPAEFRYLFAQFDVRPKFYWGIDAGLSLAQPDLYMGADATVGIAEDGGGYPLPGLYTAVVIQKPLKFSQWNLQTGMTYTQRIMQFRDSILTGQGGLSEAFGFAELRFEEHQHWIEVPLEIQRYFNPTRKNGKTMKIGRMEFAPYIFGGINLHFLLGATLEDIRRTATFPEPDRFEEEDKAGEDYPIQLAFWKRTNLLDPNASLRSRWNLSASYGGGFQVKAKNNFITAGIRFNHFLFNVIKPANRFSNDALLFDIGYLSDDARINSTAVTIGFKHILYNPKPQKR